MGPRRILVTGATGFIGRYVVDELLRRGIHVIASSAHPEKAKAAPWYDKVEYIPLDLQRLDMDRDYYHYFERPDALIHLAWEGLPNYKADFHVASNYPRHANFLKNLISHGLEDLTVVGTCLEYGMQKGCLSEDLPPMPGNSYAKAKDLLRLFLHGLRERHSFVFRWVRLFYMYGEGQNPNSLFSQLDMALKAGEQVFNMSGGEQVRDFLPVEQVADHITSIAMQRQVDGIINCCSGRPVKIKDLVRSYLRSENKDIVLNFGFYPYPDYEPMSFWGDDTKLRSVAGRGDSLE